MNSTYAFLLLHGKGGRSTGSVLQLEQTLAPYFPRASFHRPQLLHGDPQTLSEDSLEGLKTLAIPENAIVIGISLGGLLAARLQELLRPDLRVFCISSPTWADGVRLEQKMEKSVAFYSSQDSVIADRVADWPQLAQAWNLSWLDHDTDKHKIPLSKLIAGALNGENLHSLTESLRREEKA